MASDQMDDEPIKRFTQLVLFQAQQDQVTELVIAPANRERPPVRYKVEGSWHEMSPPPAHILPGVVAELGRLAVFTKRPFPKEGLIDVAYSGVRLRWVIRMTSADADCILTPIEQ
jgi:type II secretory ATPase GspE/PulE/Tfp pilus assembly ATPase PilB-like protein